MRVRGNSSIWLRAQLPGEWKRLHLAKHCFQRAAN